jgi:hypothetical protein
MALSLFIFCKNHDCPSRQQPVALNLPISPNVYEDLPRRVIPGFLGLVACPVCDFVSAYRPCDFEFREVPQEDVASTRARIACAERTCGEENCEALIRIHMALIGGSSLQTIRSAAPRWAFSLTARCGSGHQIRTRPAASYLFHWLDGTDSVAQN